MTTPTFGDLLKHYRVTAGLTQEALAAQSKVSTKAIGALEQGARRFPRPATVLLLAEALHLPPPEQATLLAAARGAWPVVVQAATGDMPAVLTPLIGRRDEVASMLQRIQEPTMRLLTLTGPAGVGKTRLALEAATQSADRFAQGYTWVDLSTIMDPNEVLTRIAQALGVTEHGPDTVLAHLARHLHAQQRLLILDNFEQVVAAGPDLLRLLAACPGITSLVTSRAALRVRGEHVLMAAPLALPDSTDLPLALSDLAQVPAVALFLYHAQAIQPDFQLTAVTAPLVTALCVSLDGLPLALELAAAQLRTWSFATLLQRLTQPLSQLQRGAVDLPPRQQQLERAIQWSYDLLTADEQRHWRALCAGAGSFTPEAAAALWDDADEGAVWDTLAKLVEQSLLQVVPTTAEDAPRFRVLVTLAAFGRARFQAAGEEALLRERHAQYYLRLAETLRTNPTDVTQLARELDQATDALRWWQAQGQATLGLRLCVAVWRAWLIQGLLSTGRAWLAQFLALASGSVSDAPVALLRVEALVSSAALATEQGDFAAARHQAEEGLALVQHHAAVPPQAEWLREQTRLINQLANIAQYQGEHAQAEVYYTEALRLAHLAANPVYIAIALNNLGTIAKEHGEMERAFTLFEESLAIKRARGDVHGVAATLLNLGDSVYVLGRLAQAQPWLEESLALFTEQNEARGITIALLNLAQVRRAQGHLAQARDLAERALTLAQEHGDQWRMALAMHHLGALAQAEQQWQTAQTHYYASLTRYHQLGNPIGVAEGLEGLAAVAAASGHHAQAACWWGAADARRTVAAMPLPLIDQGVFQHDREQGHHTLGAAAWAAAWEQGHHLTDAALMDDIAAAIAPKVG